MESRTDMLARHARELAELESRWWEEWFTEDPIQHFQATAGSICVESVTGNWITGKLPTILRKREKIGVIITAGSCRESFCLVTWGSGTGCGIPQSLSEKLAGRTLAPGEKVEL